MLESKLNAVMALIIPTQACLLTSWRSIGFISSGVPPVHGRSYYNVSVVVGDIFSGFQVDLLLG